MGYTRVYIHLVWTTKKRQKLLKKEIRSKIFEHIKNNGKDKGIYIDQINGYSDHVHCLIGLKSDQKISSIAQLLKGESAYWINKMNLSGVKFKWQSDYYAVSIGIRQLNIVRNYIKKQEQHHQRRCLDEEIDQFKRSYKFNKEIKIPD